MGQEWLKTRQTKYVAYAATYIVIIAAVLVVANFLANRYNKSFDATSNKQFTLSDQTKKVIGDLKQDVTIQYFDRPSGMQTGKDLLDRYGRDDLEEVFLDIARDRRTGATQPATVA